MQKQLSNAENDRRILSERLETVQQAFSNLKHTNQTLTDQNARLQNELANNEVQRSALQSQLRLSTWPAEGGVAKDEELLRQLQASQRERSEMKGKVDALSDKVSTLCRQVLQKSKGMVYVKKIELFVFTKYILLLGEAIRSRQT